MNKKIEEVESSLEISKETQVALQEKNLFLRKEIERLDEEVTKAVYEHDIALKDVKELKTIRNHHQKVVKENEKLKKEVKILKSKIKSIKKIQTPLDIGFNG